VKYQAVIFDLYGTLVDEQRYLRKQEVTYQLAMSEIAAIIGVPIDGLSRVWSATSRQRNLGKMKTTRETLTFICDALGVDVSDEQLDRAAAVRLEFIRRALRPRNGVLATLASLRDAGVKTGLISNCIADTSVLWPSTPFAPSLDTTILSCDVGMMKPDPGIYELACERLGVQPSGCLYIGDGSSGELTGASNVGMNAVLIRALDDTENGDREDWQGARISSVNEVFDLLA
jgi:putative hydrolase of the HAD superfamily